jgi:hypothetical protein
MTPFQQPWSRRARNIVRWLLMFFFKWWLLLKRSEYFASISILLVPEKFLPQYHTVIGGKLQNECFRIEKETTKQCGSVRKVRSPQSIGVCEAIIHQESYAFSQTFCCSRNIRLQRDENFTQNGDSARVKRSWHGKPQHGSWVFTRNFARSCHYLYDRRRKLPLIWLCQLTEFSLPGRGKPTAAPPKASSQCTCGCLVWSGKLRRHRRRRWACSYSHICSLRWNVTVLPHTRTELSTIWFQQDGATAHTARASIELVRKKLLEHVISLRGELPWPARSPDLSVCDYSFRGTSERKCTPLDHEPSMTSRWQFWSKFQRHQKTLRGEHWETCERG